MSEVINETAYGKINLTLDICGVREDGYHLLKSVMQTVDLCDRVSLSESSEGIELELIRDPDRASGHDTIPADADNLVCRAAKLLIDEYCPGRGVKIRLEKHIPAAAGMGGGSADAAAVLRGVNRLFELDLSEDKLCEHGVKLGADVPFCIKGGTVMCEGIGEVMTSLPFIGALDIVYVKPAVDVPTGKIYRMFDDNVKEVSHPDNEGITQLIRRGNAGAAEVAQYLGNVFEPLVADIHPEIGKIKKTLTDAGAAGTLMTGSGPTVFAICDGRKTAEAVAMHMRENFNDVYTGICRTVE